MGTKLELKNRRLANTARYLLCALCAVGMAASAGCAAEVYPAHPVLAAGVDVDVVEAPVEIDTYPTYVYEGRTVYLVNGGWYYRDGSHWNRYRREPVELSRRRQYVQAAPPARRAAPAPTYVHEEPRAVRPAPARPARGPRDRHDDHHDDQHDDHRDDHHGDRGH